MQTTTINGFRLSPQQERLWSLHQDNPVFVAQCALWLTGPMNAAALQTAAAQVVQRHEILRTSFHRLPGMQHPVQVVDEDAVLDWRVVDAAGDNGSAPLSLDDLLAAERRPFAFDRAPLLRMTLLRPQTENGVQRYLLAITLPALCADERTLHNLVAEIAATYTTLTSGDSGENEDEDGLQYVQFAEWQHELLAEEDAEDGHTFWRSRQLGERTPPSLPGQRTSAPAASFAPAAWTLHIAEETAQRIDDIAAVFNATPAAFLQSCWQVLLWRLSGQADLVIGDVCAGRQHEVLEAMPGLFARWLPIYTPIEENYRFDELLRHVEEARQDAYEWQEYFAWDAETRPFDAAQPPIFPIGFEYAESVDAHLAGDVRITVHRQSCYTEPFQLRLHCRRIQAGGLTLTFDFDTAHFELAHMQRVARHFETLVSSAVDAPTASIAHLPILAAEERQQILHTWNDTTAPHNLDDCLHRRFEAQAAATPDRVAVVFEDVQLTYAELNARANQLAHCLRKEGVGPDSAVGLCLERSTDLLVAILGILKAGGAYAPLDPMYPAERLAYTLADAGATVLLTQEALLPMLPADTRTVLCVDRNWAEIAAESTANPHTNVTPDNLAYVIYTSGSTGKPKGVMVQHRSVINLTAALQRAVYADLQPAEDAVALRVSVNAPVTFDSSIKQLVQIVHGRTLYVVPEEARLQGEALLDFCRRHAVDVLDCTPAQLHLLLEAGLTAADHPRTVLIGGEAIGEQTWRTLQAGEKTHFFNVYGPTECTVDATVCAVSAAPSQPVIGRPVDNVQIYILDRHLEPVPVGTAGELYIGGVCLARGYAGAPGQTAGRFMPDPFSAKSGARMYRSGDLAAYLPNGDGAAQIQFLGRADHQVKLRGFRIELGEIEAVINQADGVRESVAVVREDTPGDPRLVAYVIPRGKDEIDVAGLRDVLRRRLPEYMVPFAFVPLADLPLTRNGKVDRNRLPAPDSVRPVQRTDYLAPRTNLESTIAGIWQEVLGIEKVGVDDNFFDLGGHSLLMVRVHNRLRAAFDKEISLIEMFRSPTVGMLAKYFGEEEDAQPALALAQDRGAARREARSQRSARATRRRGSA